jgi:predicted nucleotidyltransferase
MDAAIKQQLDLLTEAITDTIPVERVYLFGSYAYGTPTADSDIDILVVVPDSPRRELDIVMDLRKAIRDKKHMPVDLLVSTSSRFDDRITAPTLEREIHEQGRLIYG